MSSPSLNTLFDQWEEALAQGRELTPEELASGRPDLLGRLREGIALLKRMQQLAGGPSSLAAKGQPTIPDAPLVGVLTLSEGAAPPLGQDAPPGYEVLDELGRGG